MKRIVFLVLILGALVAGWFARDVLQAKRGNGAPTFHGNVDIREVRLGFRVSGRIQEILK